MSDTYQLLMFAFVAYVYLWHIDKYLSITLRKKNKMADEVDLANSQVSLNEERSIKYAQLEASKPIPTSNNCYWCSSHTIEGRRFCNANCRDMWQEFGCQ